MADAPKLILCPYCGHTQPTADRCESCGGLFEPLSRRATQIAMGPWFVRDLTRPFRPGCSYKVIRRQVASGAIKANTVMRGPTTRQFWSLARNVPGVAHLLGYCHRCSQHVKPDDKACPFCSEPFREVSQRDALGLLFPSNSEAEAAQRALEREIEMFAGGGKPTATTGDERREEAGSDKLGSDLLDQVLKNAAPEKAKAKAKGTTTKSASKKSSKPSAAVATPPPLPSTGEALDFSPTDETADVAPGQRLTPTTWLLIAAVVLLLVLVILQALFVTVWTREAAEKVSGVTGEPSLRAVEPDSYNGPPDESATPPPDAIETGE